MRFILPPRERMRANNDKDPLPFYYKPATGWLYRKRLQMGLDLLPPGGQRILEVGVGSGILVPTLTRYFNDYTGTDLELAPDLPALVSAGCQARFAVANLLDPDALPSGHFDAIVCFSVLEHIADAEGAAQGLARALAPNGTLVTGYPMVNPVMNNAFTFLGYSRIDDDHVTPPAKIAAALATVLRPGGRLAFPPAAPVGLALYQCSAWTRA